MSQVPDFNFGSDAVAKAYDEVIVPYLFHPWTSRLVAEHGPWSGRRVLDVATGTGIVAQSNGATMMGRMVSNVLTAKKVT